MIGLALGSGEQAAQPASIIQHEQVVVSALPHDRADGLHALVSSAEGDFRRHVIADRCLGEIFRRQSLPCFDRLKRQQAHNLIAVRSEEHTSELQSLMRLSYAVFCLTKTNNE